MPPNVQVRRRGYANVIYYNGDDEVGGVAVTETPPGDTQLRPYVKDPVELNKDIVALVAQQMADALLSMLAGNLRVPDISPLPAPRSRCGRITARLFFAPECASETEMVSLCERLRNDVRYAPYPVWLIGAPDRDDDSVARLLTLQLAPVRGEVYREHPENVAPLQGERHVFAVPVLCTNGAPFYTQLHVYSAPGKAAFHHR